MPLVGASQDHFDHKDTPPDVRDGWSMDIRVTVFATST